ncbi:unnamed protein product [Ranitomeya imitator]|uniref:Uncharacterized protein n=1 Tax=Ranitomeya imitator TaxID=111125 RepID=A0ABN9KQ14_9NEOB|nr:unnamed protein product [Ranitomeya imitator]
MEQAGDFSMTIPLIFTALAVILATLIVKLRAARDKQPSETGQEEKKEIVAEEPSETEDKEDPIAVSEVGERTARDGAIPVEEVGTVEESPEAKDESEAEECAAKERTPSSHSSQEEEDSKRSLERRNENSSHYSDENSSHYSDEYAAPPLWEVERHIHHCNKRHHVTAHTGRAATLRGSAEGAGLFCLLLPLYLWVAEDPCASMNVQELVSRIDQLAARALGLLYDEPNSVDQAEKTLLALSQGQ